METSLCNQTGYLPFIRFLHLILKIYKIRKLFLFSFFKKKKEELCLIFRFYTPG